MKDITAPGVNTYQVSCSVSQRRNEWRLKPHEERVLDGKDGMRDGRIAALSRDAYAKCEQIEKEIRPRCSKIVTCQSA
jgi:hypothetical protein